MSGTFYLLAHRLHHGHEVLGLSSMPEVFQACWLGLGLNSGRFSVQLMLDECPAVLYLQHVFSPMNDRNRCLLPTWDLRDAYLFNSMQGILCFQSTEMGLLSQL